MLKIYRTCDEVPKGIRIVRDNDTYFNYHTVLQNNAFTREILYTINKAQYVSEFTVLGRTKALGSLSKQVLSTGTKTILNIWDMPCLVYCGAPDCHIEYKGKAYRNFYEFLCAVEKEERG